MWVDCRVLHGVCFINRGLVQLRRRKRKEGRKEGKKRWGEERLISFLKLGYDLSGFRLPLRIRIEVRKGIISKVFRRSDRGENSLVKFKKYEFPKNIDPW